MRESGWARRLISPGSVVRTPRTRLSGQPRPDLAQPLSSPPLWPRYRYHALISELQTEAGASR